MGQSKAEITLEPASIEPYILFFNSSRMFFKTFFFFFLMHEWTHLRRKWQTTPIILPGESHGQRSLAGYTIHSVSDSGTWLKRLSMRASMWNLRERVPGWPPIWLCCLHPVSWAYEPSLDHDLKTCTVMAAPPWEPGTDLVMSNQKELQGASLGATSPEQGKQLKNLSIYLPFGWKVFSTVRASLCQKQLALSPCPNLFSFLFLIILYLVPPPARRRGDCSIFPVLKERLWRSVIWGCANICYTYHCQVEMHGTKPCPPALGRFIFLLFLEFSSLPPSHMMCTLIPHRQSKSPHSGSLP